jgi:glucose-1-phosphate adenylyltransferase
MNKVVTIIMAGGEGTRLSVLAERRAKPAVPFGGIYRIIDFTLTNAMFSGVCRLGVVAQYRPYSLVDHVSRGEWWGLGGIGRVCHMLTPYTGDADSTFYLNTADAVYRNIDFLERFEDAEEVLILSGDHIYRMDYRPMLAVHRDTHATLTIATQQVPWEDTSRFGLMVCDDSGRITQFQEKPKSDPLSNKASLGIYIFNKRKLIDWLRSDHVDPHSKHDFGHNIIPSMIHAERVQNYTFEGYWRDVGTIKSYLDTSMEALDPASGLDLGGWGVCTNHQQIPLRYQYPLGVRGKAEIHNAMIARGSHVEGTVINSILSPGVVVKRGARVENSVLLNGVVVEEGATLTRTIIDKNAHIGAGAALGDPTLGDAPNAAKPHLLNDGTTVVGKSARIPAHARIGRNCLIESMVWSQIHPNAELPAGSTVYH